MAQRIYDFNGKKFIAKKANFICVGCYFFDNDRIPCSNIIRKKTSLPSCNKADGKPGLIFKEIEK